MSQTLTTTDHTRTGVRRSSMPRLRVQPENLEALQRISEEVGITPTEVLNRLLVQLREQGDVAFLYRQPYSKAPEAYYLT